MSDKIDVNKIAKLARLKLEPEEEKALQSKFQSILEYIDMISEVETLEGMEEKDESLQVTYHDDVPRSSDVSPEQFSEHVENKFFKVPQVIE